MNYVDEIQLSIGRKYVENVTRFQSVTVVKPVSLAVVAVKLQTVIVVFFVSTAFEFYPFFDGCKVIYRSVFDTRGEFFFKAYPREIRKFHIRLL